MAVTRFVRLTQPTGARAASASLDVSAGAPSTVEVLLDCSTGVPTILHWGAALDSSVNADAAAVDSVDDLAASLLAAHHLPIANGRADVVAPLTIVPEHGSGFTGTPGLRGRRGGGRAWAPRFQLVAVDQQRSADADTVVVTAEDDVAELRLVTTLSLSDVLCVEATLTNLASRRYSLDGLDVALPVPAHAVELVSMSGRWAREFQVDRSPWTSTRVSDNRAGRTSHGSPSFVAVGSRGFGEWHGEVWAAHLAWSGNHSWRAEITDDGRRMLQLGELLHPGELVLEAGESYTTPVLIGSYSDAGLTPNSWAFHRSLRRRAVQPTRPRPVLINTWEAQYFDHDMDRMRELARLAADAGVERFVLDDGWFGGRRDDRRGLGDWWVSPDLYPDGLTPLIDAVRSLGLEFGLWFEPEMVNPDSDLYRAHPEWALTTDGYEPVTWRHQLVLDLTIEEAWQHVFDQVSAVLGDHDISYVKWDMNRDHIQASSDGAAGTHAQTLAVYRLLDALRVAHPNVEFESCSSGGARVDHAVLQRAERVWVSDCNDALDRQRIQRGVSLFVPPEAAGAHIGPAHSHTTGRQHSLAFRAATAMFGHLGCELDLAALSDQELAQLRDLISLHRDRRDLLHSGDAVRFDTEFPYLAHGVYSADRSEALVAFVQLDSAASIVPPPLRFPGLVSSQRYLVEHVPLAGERWGTALEPPAWVVGRLELTGHQLATVGVRPPALHPESAVLLSFRAVAP